VVRTLVYDPLSWAEDADEISGRAEPPPPRGLFVPGTTDREPSALRAPLGSAPATRRTTTRNLNPPTRLATTAAELSTDCVIPPSFPASVIKIHGAINEPGTSNDELLKLIRAEPQLAGLLMLLANAALLGAGAKRVTELQGAVSRLGRPIIRGAAVAFAVQRMKMELRLRSIAAPLMELWRTSLGVACISQVIARRTKVTSEEAFLTGLLHGIGYLYVMARSVGKSASLGADLLGDELIGKTHPSIGKAALRRWGASDEMAQAVNDQRCHDRKVGSLQQADLSDILIASIALTAALREGEPGDVVLNGINSFQTLNMTAEDCAQTLKHAQYHLASLHLLLDG
jgi:HD-like signal output (HDOD) protein